MIMGEEEILSIQHEALDRAVFARGALSGALWLVKQKPGLYSMQDVLND
jgi:4-hydroxy-tetrahydrodipicolinate reductase